MPVVKHSFLLQSTDDLRKMFREAFYIASTGRPCPALIDIPKRPRRRADGPVPLSGQHNRTSPATGPTIAVMPNRIKQRRSEYIRRGKTRPLLMVGRWRGARAMRATRWLKHSRGEDADFPVVTTLLGQGGHAICSNPAQLSWNSWACTAPSMPQTCAMTECDLLIAVGVALLADRVTGKLSDASRRMRRSFTSTSIRPRSARCERLRRCPSWAMHTGRSSRHTQCATTTRLRPKAKKCGMGPETVLRSGPRALAVPIPSDFVPTIPTASRAEQVLEGAFQQARSP